MIPRTIHYVWLGKGKKSLDVLNCIQTWHRQLPDFKIVEWNETNAPINDNDFVRAAFENKMWAFVSDYIRAAVIKEYGGIYLDTDVNVISDLTPLLEHDFFSGYESDGLPFTAVFGAIPHHPLVERMVDDYQDRLFSPFDLKEAVNTKLVARILIDDYHCDMRDGDRQLADGIHIYSSTVLCNPSNESITIHIRNGSWTNDKRLITYIGIYFRRKIHSCNQAKIYMYLKKIHNWLKI